MDTFTVRALDAVLGPRPVDRAIRWHGEPADDRPALRIAHFGDCSWRAMDASHGAHTEPGWPLVAAGELARDGIRVAFSSVSAGVFEHLPVADPGHYLRLDGPPDVLVLQLGVQYSRRILLPDKLPVQRTRDALGRRAGRMAHPAQRPMRRVVRRVGRPAMPYRGSAALHAFLTLAAETFPGAEGVVLPPFPRVSASRWQRAVEARVHADMRVAASAHGLAFVDCPPALIAGGRRLRCANGYNLNTAGSRLLGVHLAAWLRARHG